MTTASGAGPGALALGAFAVALDAATPEQAMLDACRSLEQRVVAAGWPADLASYVRAFGIRVFEAPIEQAGRLDYEDGGYVIRVKSAQGQQVTLDPAHARGRQRFSIAHELGHALLLAHLANEPAVLAALQDPETWARVEQLCDRAAAELLVPMPSFLDRLTGAGISPTSVDRLANEFAVSREVILRRFLDAGARAVVLWTARPRTGKASVREAFSGPDGPYFGLGVDSRCLQPNIVLRAVRAGRARSAKVTIRRGVARWTVAGAAGAADAQVLLLVLPHDAPEQAHPLWQASAGRSKEAPSLPP
ncbi:MAG TPA: ImmA/IrrE family metallo-endopeptidase [Chloroflexota bacterium]